MERLSLNAVEIEKHVPFRCNVGDGYHSVNIYSDVFEFVEPINSSPEFVPFLPGWCVSSEFSEGKAATLTYLHSPEVTVCVNLPENKLFVQGPIELFASGRILAYLSLSLLERARQIDSHFLIHAAAISKDSKGMLVFGERGDGKTSTVIKLCRKFGFKLIANDLALVGFYEGDGYILNGTKILGVRLIAARVNFPDIESMFENSDMESWNQKKFLQPEDLGIESESCPQKLKSVVMVHLDFTRIDKFCRRRLNGSWMRVNLYENFSRYIRGTCLPLIGGEKFDYLGYLPSFDDSLLHFKRVEFINYLLDGMGVLSVSGGDLNELCKELDRVFLNDL